MKTRTPTKRTAAEAIAVELARLEQLVRAHEAERRKAERKRALLDEREGQEKRLALAARLGPDGRHRVEIGMGSGYFVIDRRGEELKATAVRRIAEIAAEIERVEREGVADPRQDDLERTNGGR